MEAPRALAQILVADKDQLAEALVILVDSEKDSVHLVVNDFNAFILAVSIEVGLCEQNGVLVSFFAEVQGPWSQVAIGSFDSDGATCEF